MISILLQLNDDKFRNLSILMRTGIGELDIGIDGQALGLTEIHEGDSFEFVAHLRYQCGNVIVQFCRNEFSNLFKIKDMQTLFG